MTRLMLFSFFYENVLVRSFNIEDVYHLTKMVSARACPDILSNVRFAE
jgi:hypothetical protein